MNDNRATFESFFDWTFKIGDLWPTMFLKVMRHTNDSEIAFARFLAFILDEIPTLGRVEAYNFMFMEISRSYSILKADHQGLDVIWHRIQIIAKILWKLDMGLEGIVGQKIKYLKPNLCKQEELRRLEVLDMAKLHFRAIIFDSFDKLRKLIDRNIIITWGRMIYYHVHEFQAPPRLNPAWAALDAAGRGDHYLELIEEIRSKSPVGEV